jgi:hypothetical protein
MANQLIVDFPIAPELVTPATLQSVFLGITIVLAVVVTGIAMSMSMKRRNAAPLLMVIGGLAAILMEPVVTFLGHAVHPKSGQIMMFEAVNRAIPWHIGLGYMAGFGIFYLLLYVKFVAGTLTTRIIWKTTLITALCYFVGEAIPVQQGLWVYYDYQPLWLWHGTAPLTWPILNATCMLTSTTLMFIALPHLKGLAQLLLVPLAIAGAYMGHMGAGFPMYNAMNTSLPAWAIELSGIASVGMALIIIWLCSLVLVQAANANAKPAQP